MIVPDAHGALGLARAFSGLRVLTTRSSLTHSDTSAPLRDAGAEVVAVPPTPDGASTKSLVESAPGRAALEAWSPADCVIFRADHATVSSLESLGLRVLAAPAAVARRLENKRAFREHCRQRALPVVPTRELAWPRSGQPDRSELGDMAWPRVVQTPRGFAGRRTWLWREDAPLDLPAVARDRPVLVAPLLDGATWTVNAVVTPTRVLVGPPMRQIHGDDRLSANPFASVGAEINPEGADGVRDELASLAVSVGQMARDEGFFGHFGIDAVLTSGGLVLIEMNPRLTATMTIATLTSLRAGTMPLAVAHVLVCRGQAVDVETSHRLRGGHLIIKQAPGWHLDVPPMGRYPLDSGGEVEIWPAGPPVGGASEQRCRLLFEGAIDIEEALATVLLPT